MTVSPTDGKAARVLAHWLRGPGAWLAFAIPLFSTLGRLAPTSQWRDDVAIVRGLGFLPIGGEGVPSIVLAQAASLLPVGGRVLRAGLPSAVAAALAGSLIYGFTLRLLDKNAVSPRLGPLLSLVAACGVVLGPTWQAEATVAGGASVAACLVLCAVAVRFRYRLEPRGWLVFGLVMGAAFLERRSAGVACLTILVLDAALMRQLPTGRELLWCIAATVGVVALGLGPFLLQPVRGGAWTDLSHELGRLSGEANKRPVQGALEGWQSSAGPIVLGAAAFGAVWGVCIPRLRPWIVPLLGLSVLDLALPAAGCSALAANPLAPVRLVSLAVLTIAAILALHTACLGLERAQLPLARPAQALLVVFSLTLVLVGTEESGRLAELQARRASEAWTDEALSSLPPQSMLLVRSEPAAWRLWACRVVRGERPDVTVVPLPLLDRGDTVGRLLQLEPRLAPLVRELRVSGKPSEYALSTLADSRPLYLEFDPRWDQRLLDHVLPDAFWMRFAPQALGRSDRTAALEGGQGAFTRVLRAATEPVVDAATLTMLSGRTREQAVMLAALGDRESATTLVEQLGELPEERRFVTRVLEQLKERRRGTDWMALLQ